MMWIGELFFVLAAFIILFIRLESKRKRIKEEKFYAVRKMQENSLKEALSNNLEKNMDETAQSPFRPYKVEYSTGDNQDSREKLPLLQVVEKNKFAEKNFMFRSTDSVILGIQFGTMTILSSREYGECWAELFFQKGVYCIRSCGEEEIYVRRKRKTAIVDRLGIKLKSGDEILLQDTVFQIFYIK